MFVYLSGVASQHVSIKTSFDLINKLLINFQNIIHQKLIDH